MPLCRAKRRALHSSKRWVVNLGSGPPLQGDPIRAWCQECDLQYLPVDLLEKGGKGWDLVQPAGVWSVLLWAACTGRIVTILSSPPHQTWSACDTSPRARSCDNLWGLYEPGDTGFKENVLAVQDMFLWSLASAARGSAIPFLKELPALGVRSMAGKEPIINPGSFWRTEAWSSFMRWSKVERLEFCQGSLGHCWLHPTAIATNLPLMHLAGLPKVGTPHPTPERKGNKAVGWSIGFRKELVEALGGKVKGPSVDELDEIIARAMQIKSESSEEDSECSSDSVSLTAPSFPTGQIAFETEEPGDVTVGALTSVQRQEWRSHILRGHLPYRRDCKHCVEGSGLGVQHRKIKNPQAFTLSVDLFGPMSGDQRGRDEQSVSGNPHLKYGLVAVYRLPKSCVEPITQPSAGDDQGKEDLGVQQTPQTGEVLDELAEYEPSLPDETCDDPLDLFAVDDPDVGDAICERAIEVAEPVPEVSSAGEAWISDDDLDEQIRDLTSGVELLTLKYVVGLKSKTGPDVTAGIQKLVLMINKLYPVKVLHCDPGTEFTSSGLTNWLSHQGIRIQTTIPTDKQGNGVAERAVGWLKARARTLLASASLPPMFWSLAMRYASEVHNRSVMHMPVLPAFGQKVLHKVKKPSGASKELMTRWIPAVYAAPHLTIPDGHVLVTTEGNLVASRGFRDNLVDVTAEEGLEPPVLHERESGDDLHLDLPDPFEASPDEGTPLPPSKRLREKTAVRFIDLSGDPELDLDGLAKAALLDEDYTDATFRKVMNKLELEEIPSGDRRGDLLGRYMFGAFCHGGQRGVTTLARKRPFLVRFLNRFLWFRSSGSACIPDWATVMVLRAADVSVHRDYRNEWGTDNTVAHVPGTVELWTGPPRDPKIPSTEVQPDWSSDQVHCLGSRTVHFNARNYHALRCFPGWLVVGYTPLGVHKLREVDKRWLRDMSFTLPNPDSIDPVVKVVTTSRLDSTSDGSRASSSEDTPPMLQGSMPPSSSSELPASTVDLSADIQPDSVTAFIGWDPNGGNRSLLPQENLEEADLYQFLCDREVEWTLRRLQFMGVESPADLYYLYVEDLVELGLPEEDARCIMVGIHPEGTMRPDNPNGISLRTGEVRLLDRGHRPLPWAIQNRTLGLRRPGPPVAGLGVRGADNRPDPYVEDWAQLEDPLPRPEPPPPTEFHPPVDLSGPASSSDYPPEVSAVFSEESPRAQVCEQSRASSSEAFSQHGVFSHGEQAWNADLYALHSMRLQSIWEAYAEEEDSTAQPCDQEPFAPTITTASTGENMIGLNNPAEVSADFSEESPRTQVRTEYSCRMISHTPSGHPSDQPIDSAEGVKFDSPRTIRSPTRVHVGSIAEPSFRVAFPSVMSVPSSDMLQPSAHQQAKPLIGKVVETSFTPNVEELLQGLSGPLEVVHQVSPSEVKRHLEKWKLPAQEEVDAMEGMSAIIRHKGVSAKELLRRANVEVLPAKGVFTVKPGKPFRRKVRVVSCGNYAKSVAEDVLYASGAPAETLRATLVFAGNCRRQCWSTDIKCAFLLAPIPSTVGKQYVLKPPAILISLGICTPDEYWQVCRAVYGFKEAPKWWSQYRDQELAKAKFETSQGKAILRRTVSDENLWEIVLVSGSVIGHVLVYVDDLLILGNRDTAESLHAWIRSKWGCSDLERALPHKPLRFLGVDIFEVQDQHGVRGYSLSQEGYIDELIRSHALEPSARATVSLAARVGEGATTRGIWLR